MPCCRHGSAPRRRAIARAAGAPDRLRGPRCTPLCRSPRPRWRRRPASRRRRPCRRGGRSGDVHSPVALVVQRGPRLRTRFRAAFLEMLDRAPVWRPYEGHVTVARWAQDVYPRVAEARARGVDVVYLVREVTEEATRRIRLLLIPVVRELDLGRVALGAGRQEDEREATAFVVPPPHLTQPKFLHEEVERRVEVANAEHGVEITHGLPLASRTRS